MFILHILWAAGSLGGKIVSPKKPKPRWETDLTTVAFFLPKPSHV